jgi:hypothetical protein
MFKFFETPQFHFFFSFIIGVAIMSLFRPLCKGNDCQIIKAPPPTEVEKTTYKIGNKCYQFKTNTTECPTTGVIEPFEEKPISVVTKLPQTFLAPVSNPVPGVGLAVSGL